jgi:transcriptional regulator with XRE-family HTH domain
VIQNYLQNTTPEIEAEAGKFIGKAYRDASVRESLRIGIPHQIRAIRQQRGWSQRELGEKSNKPQNVISRLEDPAYGKLSLQTLFELASAFDVALLVKFIPFSRFRGEFRDLSPESLGALPFEEDLTQAVKEKSAWASLSKQIEAMQQQLVPMSPPSSLPTYCATINASTSQVAPNIADSERSGLLSRVLGGGIDSEQLNLLGSGFGGTMVASSNPSGSISFGAPIHTSRRERSRRARKAKMQKRATQGRSGFTRIQEEGVGDGSGEARATG